MKKITLIILGLVLVNFLSAQTQLQKADSIFKYKDYNTAINLYNKAMKKATGDESKYINYQIGECYRNINNYTDAQKSYQKAITAGYDVPDIYFHLGEVLVLSGDYANAKTNFERYLKDKPNDNLAKIKLESCDLGLKGVKEKPRYEVKVQEDLSSASSDYSINYFRSNKVIISSSRIEGSGKYDPATGEGFSHLFESTYNSQKDQWSTPIKLKGSINTNFNQGTFTFDVANSNGYYTQCNGATGKLNQCNIMYAHYNSETNTWDDAKLFDLNSQAYRIQQPALTFDGNTMYFSSDMPGGYGGADLYVIKKSGNVWGQPVNLGPEINTIGNEGFPYVSGDTLLIFASDGLPGFGGLDIFECSIKDGKLSKPVNMMPPINSSADDFNLVFRDSKNEGFFCSNRPGGIGDDDIYTYKLLPVLLHASGNVQDKATGKGIEDAVAYFRGSDGKVDSVYTDSKGNYEYLKLKSNVDYSIRITKEGYLNDSKTLSVGNELYSKDYNKSTGNDLDFSLIMITKEEVNLDNIYYDFNKWDLRDDAKKELDKLINILKETPDVKVQINSHTDEKGSVEYNMGLSQKRAEAVVDYLNASGISADRLIAKGYGFSMPIVKNAKTEEENQLNRRTTFKILNPSDIGKMNYANTYQTPINIVKSPNTDVNSNQTNTNKVVTTDTTSTVAKTTNTSTATNTTSNTVTPSDNKTTTTVPANNTSSTVAKTTNTSTTTNTTSNTVTPSDTKTTTTVPANKTTTTATTTTTTTTTTTPAIPNKYYIIANSYPTKKSADDGVISLKSIGYPNAEVVGQTPNGNWRVAYSGYVLKTDAMNAMNKIKSSNPSVWLYEKKQLNN